MAKPIHLQAHTSRDRIGAVQAIQQALSSHGGWVLGHQPFSNAAMAISAELARGGVRGMIEQLRGAGIVVDADGEFPAEDKDDGQEVPIRIFVQFVHREPDMKIKGPVVPG